MTKPKIAILLASPDDNFIRVDGRNAGAILASGGIPVHVTPDSIDEQLGAVMPDGLLLPGGNFPFPADWYSGKPFYPGAASDRFNAYIRMIEWARKNSAPLLGICAGMQALGGYLGGKVTSGISNHCNPDDATHEIAITENSLLYKTIGQRSLAVNTKHNEAMDSRHAGDFKITALSDDGVIEAIEPAKPWSGFVLGVQWHPEQLAAKDEKEKLIFDGFVKAAARDA
ncbi:MAG: gamma-glutamyl-gamma-aminobutyrate hydrolase family protein [Rickettsiales bacterium]|jgi:putative glutamine amidotransferase|nr:gamma-glutamyl-gamma-aminobutyrate hydrolase family protein [Rickettsiales bacterium]